LIHTGFFHALLNALALTPLLERFEAEHGTLTSIALFVGRKYHTALLKFKMDEMILIIGTSC
jgi:membrane associated rhomboid family serine protease